MSKSSKGKEALQLTNKIVAFEDLRIADIPDALIVREPKIAYQGVHVQAPFADVFKGLKTAFEVNEKEYHFLITKVLTSLPKIAFSSKECLQPICRDRRFSAH
jgi:hypothetical protein